MMGLYLTRLILFVRKPQFMFNALTLKMTIFKDQSAAKMHSGFCKTVFVFLSVRYTGCNTIEWFF